MQGKQFINPFDLEGNWYRANFHTHTTVSDGEVTPESALQRNAILLSTYKRN